MKIRLKGPRNSNSGSHAPCTFWIPAQQESEDVYSVVTAIPSLSRPGPSPIHYLNINALTRQRVLDAFSDTLHECTGLQAPDFCYPTTLLEFVIREGQRDYLDPPDDPTSLPLSPLSSLTTTPQISCPPSPITSPSSLLPIDDPDSLPVFGPPISKTRQRKNERNKAKSKKNKKRKRSHSPDPSWNPKPPPASAVAKHVVDAPQVEAHFDFHDDATPCSTSYQGKRAGQLYSSGGYWLNDLVGPGPFQFEYINWDGLTSMPLVDQNGVLFGLLAGRPDDDPSWERCAQEGAKLVDKIRSKCAFTLKQKDHRRGLHPSLSDGISYGGGQTQPCNLHHNKQNRSVLATLANHWTFKRMSGFANGVFKTWAPRLHQYYSEHFRALLDHDDSLEAPFSNSVFAAATWNFGKWTVCVDHIDYANLPFGWCGIYALGSFNPDRGGHLVLWDPKLVIRFPPGSLIFIPSGVCRHSNTQIHKHERRFSFTQYSAGGLFRWVDHGFQTEESYKASLVTPEQQEEARLQQDGRWEIGVGMLPTVEKIP